MLWVYRASQHGDVALAKVLLEARDKNPEDHKIDINGKSAFGWAPLHYAATSGSKQMVQLLIDNKVCFGGNR
jgi:ankyrin repeat protein